MQVLEALQKAVSADNNQRAAGEQQLQQAEQNQPIEFFDSLSKVVADQNGSSEVRQLAALQLKNGLFASRNTESQRKKQRWRQIPLEHRNQIKQNIMNTLAQSDAAVSRAASQALAQIAVIELPTGEFGNVIPHLVQGIQSTNANTTARAAAIVCLGYICDEADIDMISSEHASLIVGVLISTGMANDQDVEIKRAATNAMVNALFFAEKNFEQEEERKVIVNTLLQRAQDSDETVRYQAYNCLKLMAKEYYQTIGAHMADIFNVTTSTVGHDTSIRVAASAIDFWIHIAEVEDDINEGNIELTSGNYISSALQHITDMIKYVLLRQEENEEEESQQNIAAVGGVLLKTITHICGQEALRQMTEFIESGFQNENWRKREAATLALGCLLETPDCPQLSVVVQKALPMLVDRLTVQNGQPKEPHILVRDTSSWAVGKMIETHWTTFLNLCGVSSGSATQANQFFQQLMQAVQSGLQDEPRVAVNSCYIWHNLAECLGEEENASQQNLLSGSYGWMLQALLKTAERDDADDHNLRTACFESITMLVENAPASENDILCQLFPHCLSELEKAIAQLRAESALNPAQKHRLEHQEQVMLSVINCLTMALRDPILKQPYGGSQIADVTVKHALDVMASQSASSQEEALMVITSVAGALEQEFAPFANQVNEVLLRCFDNWDNAQLVIHSANCVSEMARGLGSNMKHFAPNILDRMVKILLSVDVDKTAKPPIFGAIGDIALALGPEFDQFAALIMKHLVIFNGVDFPQEDEDEQEYFLDLRKELVDAYTSIFMSYKSPTNEVYGTITNIKGFLTSDYSIITFIKKCHDDLNNHPEWNTHELCMSLAGLLGDLASLFGKREMNGLGVSLNTPWVQQLLEMAHTVECQRENADNSIAMYAREQLQ